MKTPRNLILYALLATAVIVSCANPSLFAKDAVGFRVVSHFLTSGESLSHAKRTPMKSFSVQDYIVFFVSMQWDPTETSLGRHSVTWNWYSSGELISTNTKSMEFRYPPYELWSRRAGSGLGKGTFKVEVVVDGRLLAGNTFTIHD